MAEVIIVLYVQCMTSLIPRLHSHTRNNNVVTFDPANFILAHAIKGHAIIMTLAGESLGMRLVYDYVGSTWYKYYT